MVGQVRGRASAASFNRVPGKAKHLALPRVLERRVAHARGFTHVL